MVLSTQNDQDDRVSPEEHLANESVLVDWSSLLAIAISWYFGPHLLDILENHVAVPVECLDARQQFAVVATRNQNLGMIAHSCLE